MQRLRGSAADVRGAEEEEVAAGTAGLCLARRVVGGRVRVASARVGVFG